MIEQNTLQKLPVSVLMYKIIQALVVAVVLSIFSYFAPQFASYRIPAIIGLLILSLGHAFLYWSFFSYQVTSTQIVINSGVLYRSSKMVDFNDLQNVNVARGPLLMIFGLSQVQGFTASPAQLAVSTIRTGDQNTTTTTVKPDVDIILPAALASEMGQMMQTGRVQKVQAVA